VKSPVPLRNSWREETEGPEEPRERFEVRVAACAEKKEKARKTTTRKLRKNEARSAIQITLYIVATISLSRGNTNKHPFTREGRKNCQS
jgi:hypothetical protein